MAKVLVTARSVAASGEIRAILESAGHEVIVHVGDSAWPEAEMLRIVPGVDAVIAGLDEITARVFAAGSPTLKIVARNGAGYDNVDVEAAGRLGIAVTLAPGANTMSVCELAFGLMLSLARRIPELDANVRQGSWKRALGVELHGKVLGVLGTGSIGSEVIKRAHAFGMIIVAFDILRSNGLCRQFDLRYLPREDVFRQADFLTLHLPVTVDTRNTINAATLGVMKKTAFIINTARGELVDEKDLYDALRSGEIAGYGTDTFSQEPPATGNPLLTLPNVIATPHCGAYTKEAVARCGITAAQEVVRVLGGQAPLYAVKK